MKKLLYIFALLLLSQFSFAQELNAQVQINYQQVEIFKTMKFCLGGEHGNYASITTNIIWFLLAHLKSIHKCFTLVKTYFTL